MSWLALHGVPVGPKVWSKLSLSVETPSFTGIATNDSRSNWELESFVNEMTPYAEGKIVLGQDLGGVVAAMLARRVRVRAVVLTGTALGPWWALTRLSAHPWLAPFFYRRFEGRLFARLGQMRPPKEGRLTPDISGPAFAERMKALALNMKPPKGLAQELKAHAPVHLIWGQGDLFYPPMVAMALSQALEAPIHWIEGGHYCMWEQADSFSKAMMRIEGALPKQTIELEQCIEQ